MYVGGKVIPFARSAFRFCFSDGRDRWRVHMCDYGIAPRWMRAQPDAS